MVLNMLHLIRNFNRNKDTMKSDRENCYQKNLMQTIWIGAAQDINIKSMIVSSDKHSKFHLFNNN